jgi:glycosyltransferase involved in cell wall biosynthesis
VRAETQSLARQVYPGAEFKSDLRGAPLAALFDAADLFVLPGTGGLAVQQAMSHALPVMVAEGDGTQANLVRPANGWRLPPNDEQALHAALREALVDPARLRRMGAESYRIVAEEVNLEKMVAVFTTVIQRVLAERN